MMYRFHDATIFCQRACVRRCAGGLCLRLAQTSKRLRSLPAPAQLAQVCVSWLNMSSRGFSAPLFGIRFKVTPQRFGGANLNRMRRRILPSISHAGTPARRAGGTKPGVCVLCERVSVRTTFRLTQAACVRRQPVTGSWSGGFRHRRNSPSQHLRARDNFGDCWSRIPFHCQVECWANSVAGHPTGCFCKSKSFGTFELLITKSSVGR